jgi:hypothetical protein
LNSTPPGAALNIWWQPSAFASGAASSVSIGISMTSVPSIFPVNARNRASERIVKSGFSVSLPRFPGKEKAAPKAAFSVQKMQYDQRE